MDSNPLRPWRCATFWATPVTRLSTQRTCQPSSSSRSQRCEPRKPAPPVTTARIVRWKPPPPYPSTEGEGNKSGSADASVDKTELAHNVRFVQVPAVDDNRPPHHSLHPLEVQLAKFLPLGDEQNRIRPVGRFICIATVLDVVQCLFENRHGFGIVSAHPSAFLFQAIDDVDGRRFANVVGIRFIRESKDGDNLIAKPAQDLAQLFDKQRPLIEVDLHHRIEQFGVVTKRLRYPSKRFNVLRETRSAIPNACVEEHRADPAIHSHSLGNDLATRVA